MLGADLHRDRDDRRARGRRAPRSPGRAIRHRSSATSGRRGRPRPRPGTPPPPGRPSRRAAPRRGRARPAGDGAGPRRRRPTRPRSARRASRPCGCRVRRAIATRATDAADRAAGIQRRPDVADVGERVDDDREAPRPLLLELADHDRSRPGGGRPVHVARAVPRPVLADAQVLGTRTRGAARSGTTGSGPTRSPGTAAGRAGRRPAARSCCRPPAATGAVRRRRTAPPERTVTTESSCTPRLPAGRAVTSSTRSPGAIVVRYSARRRHVRVVEREAQPDAARRGS